MNNYYDHCFQEYIKNTLHCNMEEQYNLFLKYLSKQGTILDVGFGSGRDMIYFNKLGYSVIGVDSSLKFCMNMSSQGFKVYNSKIEDFFSLEKFDGIWACASLVHVQKESLASVLGKLKQMLKEDGVMYLSFKYGFLETEIDGRYFNNLNEETIKNLASTQGLKVVEILVTNDVRKEKENEKWLNVILKQ